MLKVKKVAVFLKFFRLILFCPLLKDGWKDVENIFDFLADFLIVEKPAQSAEAFSSTVENIKNKMVKFYIKVNWFSIFV